MHLGPVLAVAAGGLAALWSTPVAADASFLGRYIWTVEADGFGGFSGLELSQDGQGFTATTDDGMIATGTLTRDQKGVISGVALSRFAKLLGTGGAPVGRFKNDAEGIAEAPDGTLFVSFEGEHRVWQYDTPEMPATPLPIPAAFAEFQRNSALEAIAIGPNGALYTLPERSGEWTRPFPVWRYADGAWSQPFDLPRRDKLLPVGADFGPDGRFYLLERELVSIFGFRIRVRSFALGPDGFGNERTEFTSAVAAHDNLEGLSVWQDADGRTRLTMISDDNYNAFQVTEFVEYVLTE